MANPLIGSRISLISKKNIRYEGTLYSINEGDATVALQNVKSYGTEGREQGGTFVPPQDAVHPYLVFRGSDIKDLHVHEKTTTTPQAPEPTDLPAPPPPPTDADKKKQPKGSQSVFDEEEPTSATPAPPPPPKRPGDAPRQQQSQSTNSKPRQPRQPRNRNNSQHQVGTGASLLNRKARGVVDGKEALPKSDFDFEENLTKFEKDEDETAASTAYEKDDFFDSISCDAIDKERGVDNRLRGSQERTLNTETFGAVALNTNRRYNRRGRGGRGRGRGGRGRGRGGRGRGRNRGYGQQHSNSSQQQQHSQQSKSVAAS